MVKFFSIPYLYRMAEPKKRKRDNLKNFQTDPQTELHIAHIHAKTGENFTTIIKRILREEAERRGFKS